MPDKQIPPKPQILTDQHILKKHHRFLRDSDSDSSSEKDKKESPRDRSREKDVHTKYGEELAKKYYGKLFKQYAVVDLSRYESGQIGCRWRTQKQVMGSKCEKFCAGLGCSQQSKETYQMNFGYVEQGRKKNALIKVRVCRQCGVKLNLKKSLKRLGEDHD